MNSFQSIFEKQINVVQDELHFGQLSNGKQMTEYVEGCHAFYDPVAEYMEKRFSQNGWLCVCSKDQVSYHSLLSLCYYVLISIKHEEET